MKWFLLRIYRHITINNTERMNIDSNCQHVFYSLHRLLLLHELRQCMSDYIDSKKQHTLNILLNSSCSAYISKATSTQFGYFCNRILLTRISPVRPQELVSESAERYRIVLKWVKRNNGVFFIYSKILVVIPSFQPEIFLDSYMIIPLHSLKGAS